MGVLDRITGHISGSFNSRLATSVYVHMQADQHRDYFERLNAELCNTEDSEVTANWDNSIYGGGEIFSLEIIKIET